MMMPILAQAGGGSVVDPETQMLIAKSQAIVAEFGLSILAAIAIFFVGKVVAGVLRNLLVKLMKKSKVDETLVTFTSNLAYFAMMTFVVIAVLSKLGIQTTSFIAVLGAAGLAIGLALQGSLSNFASGVLLILFRPFKVGDLIEAGGTFGVVQELQIFTTHILTPDNKLVIVPNSKVGGDNITNLSTKDCLRVDMTFGIGYDDDVDLAKEIMMKLCTDHPKVLKEPAPTVAMVEHADSSVNFVCRPFATVADYWDVYFDVTEGVKKAFDEKGISIPFPQQDVHMHQVSADAG
jgi:small conductance mechanosensitive channel